jgi:hypothetical protein
MTREEFIGRAAVPFHRALIGLTPQYINRLTEAALEAVGAFELYELAQQMEPADYPHAAEFIAKLEGR